MDLIIQRVEIAARDIFKPNPFHPVQAWTGWKTAKGLIVVPIYSEPAFPIIPPSFFYSLKNRLLEKKWRPRDEKEAAFRLTLNMRGIISEKPQALVSAIGPVGCRLQAFFSKTLEFSDYAYVMANGETMIEGAGRDLLNNDQVQKVYLGID